MPLLLSDISCREGGMDCVCMLLAYGLRIARSYLLFWRSRGNFYLHL